MFGCRASTSLPSHMLTTRCPPCLEHLKRMPEKSAFFQVQHDSLLLICAIVSLQAPDIRVELCVFARAFILGVISALRADRTTSTTDVPGFRRPHRQLESVCTRTCRPTQPRILHSHQHHNSEHPPPQLSNYDSHLTCSSRLASLVTSSRSTEVRYELPHLQPRHQFLPCLWKADSDTALIACSNLQKLLHLYR
jgi:hypothetical protein